MTRVRAELAVIQQTVSPGVTPSPTLRGAVTHAVLRNLFSDADRRKICADWPVSTSSDFLKRLERRMRDVFPSELEALETCKQYARLFTGPLNNGGSGTTIEKVNAAIEIEAQRHREGLADRMADIEGPFGQAARNEIRTLLEQAATSGDPNVDDAAINRALRSLAAHTPTARRVAVLQQVPLSVKQLVLPMYSGLLNAQQMDTPTFESTLRRTATATAVRDAGRSGNGKPSAAPKDAEGATKADAKGKDKSKPKAKAKAGDGGGDGAASGTPSH